MEASYLQVGSLPQTEDGRVIDADKVEKRAGQFEVYNFKVEGFYTYFVSDKECQTPSILVKAAPVLVSQGEKLAK